MSSSLDTCGLFLNGFSGYVQNEGLYPTMRCLREHTADIRSNTVARPRTVARWQLLNKKNTGWYPLSRYIMTKI